VARESFLLRTDPKTLNALRRWAGDELRSVNGQIEYLLLKALRQAGRLEPEICDQPPVAPESTESTEPSEPSDADG